MKIFTKHFDHKPIYDQKLKDYKHLDVSIFCDIIPQSGQFSSINVMILQEPDEYFGLHTWTIKNQELFQLILSWNDRVLNNCIHSMYTTFGGSWLLPEQYTKSREKKFEIAHLSGKLQMSYGHSLRHEILSRQDEIKIPKRFFHTYGERDDISKARIGKEEVFADSMFNIAIENFSHRGYFTEKLLDCFLFKTLPIYWGCSNIGEYFNEKGIIKFENVDDLIEKVNWLENEKLLGKDYRWLYPENIIEENYNRALQYLDFEQNAIDKILKIFEHNEIS